MSNESVPMVALYKALSKAQKKMSHATKDAVNPAFKSKYADLSAIIDATLPVLNEHGLSIAQMPTYEVLPSGSIEFVLVTKLMHDDGGLIECRTPIIVRDQTNPQSMGSGITYARRYALSALCCIAQEDDDGEGAKSGSVTKAHPVPSQAPTKRQLFEDAVMKLGKSESMKKLLGTYGVEYLRDLKEDDFNRFYSELQKK